MSDADLAKWELRYRGGAYAERTHASAFLAAALAALPGGRALDVACGAGRNALFLAAAGYSVDAVDISPAALERARRAAEARGLDARWIEADLDAGLPESLAARYDLIVVIRYVNLPLMRSLIERLAPGGCLLVEEHLLSADPDVAGPRDPRFRLRPNELRHAASPLRVVSYREGRVVDPDGRPVALAQLVAERADGDE